VRIKPDLLGKKHSITDAEHTLRMVMQSYKEGDYRLTISRGITAIIQASFAASINPDVPEIVERADKVIQSVRKIIQGIIISRALGASFDPASGRGFERRRLGPKPPVWSEIQHTLDKDKDKIKNLIRSRILTLPSVPFRTEEEAGGESVFVPAEDPIRLWSFLVATMRTVKNPITGKTKTFITGVLPYDMVLRPNGIYIDSRSINLATTMMVNKSLTDPQFREINPTLIDSLQKTIFNRVENAFTQIRNHPLHSKTIIRTIQQNPNISPEEVIKMEVKEEE